MILIIEAYPLVSGAHNRERARERERERERGLVGGGDQGVFGNSLPQMRVLPGLMQPCESAISEVVT